MCIAYENNSPILDLEKTIGHGTLFNQICKLIFFTN